MGIGPFSSYVPPGVYTNTIVAADGAAGFAGLRIPVFVGVGEETYTVRNLEVVRGSSAKVDTISNREDMAGRFVDPDTNALVAADGEIAVVRVRNVPIVSGDGTGSVATQPSQVKVRINGEAAGVARVDGLKGEVYIAQKVLASDVVDVTYYWHRGDLLVEAEDHSDILDMRFSAGTKTSAVVPVRLSYAPLVDATGNGAALAGSFTLNADLGIIDADSPELNPILLFKADEAKIEATVSLYGLEGLVEIPITEFIPSDDPIWVDGALNADVILSDFSTITELKVSYWTNTYQNTSDPLPNKQVVEIIGQGVGLSPNKTTDYVEGLSFVNEGDSINWGAAFSVAGGVHTPQAEYFDDSQVKVSLVDSYLFKDKLTPVNAVAGQASVWAMKFDPVDGSGFGRPTQDLTKVSVFGAGIETPVAISGNKIIFGGAMSTATEIFVSYYYNDLRDDTYTVKVMSEGASGDGTYSVSSLSSGPISHASVNVAATNIDSPWVVADLWQDGVEDLQTVPKFSKAETITVTFTSSTAFTVTSSLPTGGTTGSGVVGRTFYNSSTGVRFTLTDDGLFSTGDVVVINVVVDPELTSGTVQILDLPGIKLQVLNTLDCAEDDTAIVKAFAKEGPEPAIGEFYYVSYKHRKEDFAPKIFTKIKNIEAEYGNINIDNKLSLAAYLAFLNGATAVGFKQVLKTPGKGDASSTAYNNAIMEIEKKIDGLYNADIVVPLTTLPDVQTFAKAHVEKMSSERFQGERMAFLGCPLGTTPVKAQLLAKNLLSSRVVLLYPDGVVLGILDEMGMENEYLVDGSMLAAALAGKVVSPQYDEATDMTRKELVGFKRLSRVLDSVESNQTAVAGVTVLEDLRPSIRIRQWFTTDMASVLTRTPYVTQVIDKVQKDCRGSLESFIGKKNLPSLVPSMKGSLASTLQSLVATELISEFSGVDVKVSPLDPTIILAEAFYKPVFSVSWVRVTLNVRA